ncbi:MAG: phosphonate ABC transporter, permease protein PhnE [Chlorobiota bacterium]
MTRRHWQGIVVDFLLGTYAAVVLHRVVWQHMVVGSGSETISAVELAAYVGGGALTVAIGLGCRCTLGAWISAGGHVLRPWQQAGALHWGLSLLVLTVWAGWVVTKISPLELFSPQGLESAGRLFRALLIPEFSILDKALAAMVQTIYIALMATLAGLPPALLLGFLAARNVMRRHPLTFALYAVLRVLINFTRSVEPLIWAVIFSVWVGIGPFAGMLAMTVHTVAALAKLYSEQVESVDPGLIEAVESTGAHPIQVVWFGIVPQVVLPFLAFTIYRWDTNVRMATVIGLVGGGGIGTLLMQYQGLARWHEVGLIVLVIAAVVWVLDYASARLREVLA